MRRETSGPGGTENHSEIAVTVWYLDWKVHEGPLNGCGVHSECFGVTGGITV